MIAGIIGKKLGMNQVFAADGKVQALTVIEAGPCTVVQVKTVDKDGYSAVQLGFGEARKLSSPELGHLKGLGKFRYLREFRVADLGEAKPGDKIDVSVFKSGDRVQVTGTTKGKGFAGVVKRHHFKGGPKTHGQSDRHRAPGAIGSTTTPGHILKGVRMAGHMGHDRSTALNLVVVTADAERNLLMVRGAVPGAKNGLLMISRAGES